MAKIAYGKKEDIASAIENGIIPENTVIITSDEEPEFLFYDNLKKLKLIEERDRFDNLLEASQWLEKYNCRGLVLSVFADGEWKPYIVNEKNELVPFVGQTTNLKGEIFNNYENNIAGGEYSHAEGFETIAEGTASHAEGYETTAYSKFSHAEGLKTKALGQASHAEGQYTHAGGYYSHAEGFHTITHATASHVQGKYNIVDNEQIYAHIVGNGTSYTDPSNAHTIDWDGNAWFAGDVVAGDVSLQKLNDSLVENCVLIDAKVDTLIGTDTNKSVRTIANEELVAQLIKEDAQESLDTLQEIAAWLQDHPEDAAAMNQDIEDLKGKLNLTFDGVISLVDIYSSIESRLNSFNQYTTPGIYKVEIKQRGSDYTDGEGINEWYGDTFTSTGILIVEHKDYKEMDDIITQLFITHDIIYRRWGYLNSDNELDAQWYDGNLDEDVEYRAVKWDELFEKQNKTDDALTTTDKTIVGAINEINNKIFIINVTVDSDGNYVADKSRDDIYDAIEKGSVVYVRQDNLILEYLFSLENITSFQKIIHIDDNIATINLSIYDDRSCKVDYRTISIGSLSALNTQDKSTIVGAINEVNTDIANLETQIGDINTALENALNGGV